MAELHDALKSLAPIDWEDVPKSELKDYIQELVQAGDLIVNSVPPPADGNEDLPSNVAKTAQNAAETGSNIRAPASHPEHEALHSSWGKPMKFSSKENPLQVAVFKMAGKDRHGAWFARRSVHEGIGFNKFRTAMLKELPQSIAVKGGPGAGCIRGIAGDQQLEDLEVEAPGRLEVLQLSAQFPGPTTPREFITLLLTDHTTAKYSNGQQGRQLMVLSKPISHPEAPERSGYIRGQYESVELIREIPLKRAASKSTPHLLSTAEDDPPGKLKRSKTNVEDVPQPTDDEAEANPVEWIMVTRSDPGGGIPRFMVDRGTPGTMLGDITKFLNWAVKVDEGDDPYKTVERSASQDEIEKQEVEPVAETAPPAEGGVLASLTNALEAGLDAYAPTMVSSFVHDRLHRRTSFSSSSDSSIVSSTASFASAADVRPDAELIKDHDSDATSMQSDMKSITKDKHHDKELQKIQDAKDKLEQRLAKKREEEDVKLQKSQEDEHSEASKALERHNKEIKKQEERHQKELAKLEAKRDKEMKKFEEKKRKHSERDALQKVTRERDDFRTQVDLLKKENALLRERIESLENMMEK